MKKVLCPKCLKPQGPLINNLLIHLNEAHGQAVDWYDALTGDIKLQGWRASELQFVEEI